MDRLLSAILARCEPDGDCLIWMGSRAGRGPWEQRHGRAEFNGVPRGVHVVVWEAVAGGAVPEGYEVCHTCDNPPCVWPGHLWLGTHAQNMLDCKLKRRYVVYSGESSVRAKLTEAQVRVILADLRHHHLIAADFGVAISSIAMIKRRERWKHVQLEEVA